MAQQRGSTGPELLKDHELIREVRRRASLSRSFGVAFCLEVISEDALRRALMLIEAKKGKPITVKDPKTGKPAIDHETGESKIIRLGGQDQDRWSRQLLWDDRKEFRRDPAFDPELRLSDDLEAMRTNPKVSDEEFIAEFLGVDLDTLKRQFRKRPKKRHKKSQPKRRKR